MDLPKRKQEESRDASKTSRKSEFFARDGTRWKFLKGEDQPTGFNSQHKQAGKESGKKSKGISKKKMKRVPDSPKICSVSRDRKRI